MDSFDFINEFKNWWQDETDTNFCFICVGYNPKKKDKTKINKFDLFNNISNKSNLAKIIYESASKNIGKRYAAQLFYSNTEWIDKKAKKNIELLKIQKYLLKYLGRELIGGITFKSLFSFLNLFLKYPAKYMRQPIIVNSLEKNVIIFLTDHETVFIVSKDEKLIEKIGKELDRSGANVLFSKHL